MATLTYYSFSKRHRSTLQPTSGTDLTDVYLKDGCSITKPVFLLSFDSPPTFNYMKYEGRYYFVTEIRNVANDFWEIEGEEDYLSSWKTEIGSAQAMILYASGSTANIIDPRIQTTSPIYVSTELDNISDITLTDNNQGTIILSITGKGSFGNYVMEQSNKVFELIDNVDIFANANITDAATGLKQLFMGGNAGANIKGAIALPFLSSNMLAGGIEDLYLGAYPCTDSGGNPIRGYKVTDPIAKGSFNVNIPWRYSDWRRHSPYTALYLYLPLIGTMALPVDDLINDSSIHGNYAINITSGSVSVEIYGNTSGKIIATASSNCAMATPFGSSNIDVSQAATGIISGATAILGGLAASNPLTKASIMIGGTAASIAGFTGAYKGENSGTGGLGGGSSHGLTKVVRLTSISKDLTDSQANLDPIMGKPLMKKDTIGNYSGYVQTDGAQVLGAMLGSEAEMINSLLDGGIYYE